MKLNKILISLMALFPLAVSAAQYDFLGKRFLVDVNVSTATNWVRPFDLNKQFAFRKGESEEFWFSLLDDYYEEEQVYVNSDGESEDMKFYQWWNCNIMFSADIEGILWKKGSLMLEARMDPYNDYYFQNMSVYSTDYDMVFNRMGQERSFEAGIGYRQYLFSSSNAPYGRYIQVGLNRLQVQWKHDCINTSAISDLREMVEEHNKESYSYSQLALSEVALSNFLTEKKAGYENLWSLYFELGYNYMLWHDRLRLSLSMRTAFPIGYTAEESDVDNPDICNNAAYYAIRRYWSANLFSLKAGIGFLIF